MKEKKKASYMSKTYYEQFRNNQNGYNSKNPTKTKPRPTAIKQSSPRSDTFLVSNKQNEPSSKFSKVNGTRRAPLPAQPPPPPPPQPSDRKRTDPLQRKAPSRPAQKLLSPSSDQVDYGRKPVRFAQQNNPSAYPQRPAPPHPSDPSRRMRVTNDDYVIQRRRGPPPAEYIYDDDYRSVSLLILISLSHHESYYYSSEQKTIFLLFYFMFLTLN